METTFVIGIDTWKGKSTYALSMKEGDRTQIILIKTMDDKKAFDEEVGNLQKYFNAIKLEETD